MRELGFDYRIQIALHNQVFPSCWTRPALSANRDDVNVLLARFEDWAADATRLETHSPRRCWFASVRQGPASTPG
jgi:hypothetical protein